MNIEEYKKGIICDCNVVHYDIVNEVLKHMLKDEVFYDLADLFKIFGDYTRIKILYALFKSSMCVCDIAVLLNMTKSSISHQLRILKQVKLVKYEKVGRVVYYSLDDEHVGRIFEQGLLHVNEKH
jgi:ArsR family transcriptional regulator